MMITSTANAQVKHVIQLNTKAKVRKEEGLFVVEGLKMFQEAPAVMVEQVFISETFLKNHGEEISYDRYAYEVVSDKVYKAMSDTKSPQGIMCLMRQMPYTLEEILTLSRKKKGRPLLLVLEDLQDPGNLGTIFRTAEGAGVDGIILSRNSVDIYNPKTIRSTMGSIYRMPFVYVENLIAELPKLEKAGIHTYAAHLHGINDYDENDYTRGTAFFIGNEGNGLSEELSEKADSLIKIPMEGQLESLNAAMAAGILSYEAFRQRRA